MASPTLVLDVLHLRLAQQLYAQPSQRFTAAELAKQLNLDLDAVKKRLTTLRLIGLVQTQESQPKRYCFEVFCLRKQWQPAFLAIQWRPLFIESNATVEEEDQELIIKLRDWLLSEASPPTFWGEAPQWPDSSDNSGSELTLSLTLPKGVKRKGSY